MCTIRFFIFFSILFFQSLFFIHAQNIDWKNASEKELRPYLDLDDPYTRADGSPHELDTYVTHKIIEVWFFLWKIFTVVCFILIFSMYSVVCIRQRKVNKLIEQGKIIVPVKKEYM